VNHYVLVCGGRDFDDRDMMFPVLEFLRAFYGPGLRVMHGAARGADALAADIADQLGVVQKGFPADWAKDGRSAGPIRNRRMGSLLATWMLQGHTVEVLAFPGGSGTRDMCQFAESLGIAVTLIPEPVSSR
jgi:hypothetical protein